MWILQTPVWTYVTVGNDMFSSLCIFLSREVCSESFCHVEKHCFSLQGAEEWRDSGDDDDWRCKFSALRNLCPRRFIRRSISQFIRHLSRKESKTTRHLTGSKSGFWRTERSSPTLRCVRWEKVYVLHMESNTVAAWLLHEGRRQSWNTNCENSLEAIYVL